MNNFSSPGKGEKACFTTDISHTQPTNLLRIPDDALGIKPGASVSLLYQQSEAGDSPGPSHTPNLQYSVRAGGAERLPESQEHPTSSSKARAEPAIPPHPVSWVPRHTAPEFHVVQGQEGLGGALTSARYQLHCHVTHTPSNTNCKSYSGPSEKSHSLCSQARETH